MKIFKKANNLFVHSAKVGLLALTPFFMNSCEKEQPVQRPERHVATKEVTIDFNFNENWSKLNDDTLIYYANLRDMKHVILNYIDTTNATMEFTPVQFEKKAQILGVYFAAYDNVIGQGEIKASAFNPSETQKGINEDTYRALKTWGYDVQIASNKKNKIK